MFVNELYNDSIITIALRVHLGRQTNKNTSETISYLPSVKNQSKQTSLVMRKPDFCICENKDADQFRGNSEADQRLCFRYTDSTIPLLPKSEISSL